MKLTLITQTTDEPLTRAEVKQHLLLEPEDASRDAEIDALIPVAREQAEAFLNKVIRPATYQMELSGFNSFISFPVHPVRSIESISYTNWDTTEMSLPAEDYFLSLTYVNFPFYLNYNAAKVVITFKVGYPEGTNGLASIKHWMKLFIADLFENHETVVKGQSVNKLPFDRLLLTEKRYV